MKNNELKKYAEMKADKQKEMTDLVEKVKGEERAMTLEEDELFNQLEKDIQAINDTVAKINKSRQLTEEDGASKNDEKEEKNMSEEERAMEIEQRDIEDFAKYIRGEFVEQRADGDFGKGKAGAVIPTTIANKIIMTAYNMSPILEKCTPYNTKGKLSIPVYGKDSKGNDITVSYAEDFTDLVEKAGAITSVDLDDYLIGALAKLGNSLINNTDIDLVNMVINIIAEYVKIFLEGQILNGSNKITGCKDITRIHEVPTAVITYDDLVKLKNKVIQSFRKGSIWVMNQDTETAIELIKDANDNPIFVADPTGEFDGKVLGYPVYVSDNMAGIEAGKRPIIFGNFSGIALKKSKDLELQILKEKYATQHATGIVAWLEADAKVEHLQKLSALDIKSATTPSNPSDNN